MEVELRRLTEGDSLGELTSLLNRAYAELAEQGLRYVATWQDATITAKRIREGECWVAHADGRLVGTITFRPPGTLGGCAWYERTDVASFGQLGVDPDWRGRRIGTRLVELAERRAQEMGAAEVALNTAEPAEHLVAWYTRRGYRVVDHADWPHLNYRSVILSLTLQP